MLQVEKVDGLNKFGILQAKIPVESQYLFS